MRYIFYILCILVILSAVVGYQFIKKRQPVQNAAIIINDRIITTDEFNTLYNSLPADRRSKTDFINSLIVKELLIQEAQEKVIDKEEPFRCSIKNFYEQSLIKLLMDRKFSSIQVIVTDDELKRYRELSNRNVTITIFNYDDENKAKKGVYRDSEQMTVSFEDLCDDIRYSIISLNEGDMLAPIKMGEKYTAVRLDKTEKDLSQPATQFDREQIRQTFTEWKKEKIIDDWIARLSENASIKILININD